MWAVFCCPTACSDNCNLTDSARRVTRAPLRANFRASLLEIGTQERRAFERLQNRTGQANDTHPYTPSGSIPLNTQLFENYLMFLASRATVFSEVQSVAHAFRLIIPELLDRWIMRSEPGIQQVQKPADNPSAYGWLNISGSNNLSHAW